MHQFLRNKHRSVVGMTVLVLLVVVIISAHIVGISVLSRNVHASSVYIWPLLLATVAVVAWHRRKIHAFKMHSGHVEANDADIVSRDGLHWHPEISIYVKGVKQAIPQTGITNMDMSAMHALHKRMQMKHMHDGPNEQGIVHLKFEGIVRKSDIMLGKVFKKWGKDIRSYSSNLRMTVNGNENTEYENYIMQDKDKIELNYE